MKISGANHQTLVKDKYGFTAVHNAMIVFISRLTGMDNDEFNDLYTATKTQPNDIPSVSHLL